MQPFDQNRAKMQHSAHQSHQSSQRQAIIEREWREEGVEEKKVMVSLLVFVIDPMQKWLPLNYYFVHIQNSPTNLVLRQKFKRICYPERG